MAFDNWFSTVQLFVKLAARGILAISTFQNRRFKGLNFPSQLERRTRNVFQRLTTHSRKRKVGCPRYSAVEHEHLFKRRRGPALPIPEKTVQHDGFTYICMKFLPIKVVVSCPFLLVLHEQNVSTVMYFCVPQVQRVVTDVSTKFHAKSWYPYLSVFPYLWPVMPNGNKARTHHRSIRIGKELRHLLFLPERLWKRKLSKLWEKICAE